MTTFQYDPSKTPQSQIDAAIAATTPSRRVTSGLEIAIGLMLVIILATALIPFPQGLVAARRIAKGAAIHPQDVRLVSMPADPVFVAQNAVDGYFAAHDLEFGEPLRRDSVVRPWAAARDVIQNDTIITPGSIEFKTGPFIDSGFTDLAGVVGRKAKTVIAKGTIIRASMIDPQPSAMIALRDIEPFVFLTADDAANPRSNTCVAVHFEKGAVIQSSDLVTVDPHFDTLLSVKLANTVARTEPGSAATLMIMSKTQDGKSVCSAHLPVQVLRVTASGDGANVIVALPAKEHGRVLRASELRALQEVH